MSETKMKGGSKMANEIGTFDYSDLIGRMAKCDETRQELSAKIGFNPAYFGRVLSTGRPIGNDKIFQIAKVLGIPLEEIGLYFFTLKV